MKLKKKYYCLGIALQCSKNALIKERVTPESILGILECDGNTHRIGPQSITGCPHTQIFTYCMG